MAIGRRVQLDKLELQRQFLPPQIKALHPDMVLIGRAMPVLEADVYAVSVTSSQNPLMSKPFGLMLHALDDLKANEELSPPWPPIEIGVCYKKPTEVG